MKKNKRKKSTKNKQCYFVGFLSKFKLQKNQTKNIKNKTKKIKKFVKKKLKKGKKSLKKFRKKIKKNKFISIVFKPFKFIFNICFRTKIGRILSGFLLISCSVYLFFILKDLPSPNNITSRNNYSVSTLIYDRNGELLYEIYADENRIPIKLNSLPDHVLQATIAIEDKNFYKHWGFDLKGISRAVYKMIKKERLEGGSTITQQLVKNSLLTSERSVQRKIKEAILSIAVEVKYSKQEILEMYLNYISYGGTAVGIQSASKKFFDKDAKDLTLAEASLLAGLPQAPSYYSPFGSNPQKAKQRQADVLRRMTEDGYITQQQANEALKQDLNYALKKTDIKAPHFVFYIRDLLYEKYGEQKVKNDGFRVYTTLDLETQKKAQEFVRTEIEKIKHQRVSNGAALITKPNTGEILAMVGSIDYFDSTASGQFNVTLASRQPGSSIKPLLYATAFQEKKLNPGSLLLDIPTCFTDTIGKKYCPQNYTNTFAGPVTVRQSLGNSLNIPAVKTLRIIGVYTFMKQAEKMGITTWDDPTNYGLSLSLGAGEVKMIDMAQAFGVLANNGIKVPLSPIKKIQDYQGNTIEQTDYDQRKQDLNYLNTFDVDPDKQPLNSGLIRVMDAQPAYMTAHIMQDNRARSMIFGTRSQLAIKDKIVSVKTGTTNKLKDNWTIGFTPEFLTITWVGNNNNESMNALASGLSGAAPIFNDIMTHILQDQETSMSAKPIGVKTGQVCYTGLPDEISEISCQPHNKDIYWDISFPTRSRSTRKEIWVKADTGIPPKYGEQADNLILETHTIYQDPLTDLYCQDCTRPIDENGKIIYEEYIVPYDYRIKELHEAESLMFDNGENISENEE